jgi:choline dehydrogenase-like flavoprotein
VSDHPYRPTDPQGTVWDVVIVGTGMGGSTLGYALARMGRKVLFIEKGQFLHGEPSNDALSGAASLEPGEDPQRRLAGGHWPLRIVGDGSFGPLEFFAPLGCGTGGTTTLYAAALERLRPADFAPRAQFPQATDSTLPERWPIRYEDLEPYYRQAEALFRVCGDADPLSQDAPTPLREPLPLGPRDQHLRDSLTRLGLHPYRIHVGCEYKTACEECAGRLCRRACKSDAATVCLLPALRESGAALLTECEVVKLSADASRVTHLHCMHGGRELTIRASVFVLAAGAYMTPVLLLNSASPTWPVGLANRSGLVGRNLMVHVADYIALTPLERLSAAGPQKCLALNDFYQVDGEKLGSFQAVGASISPGQIMQYIRDVAERDPRWWVRLAGPRPSWWRRLASPLVRALSWLLFHAFNFKNAAVWGAVVEDLPYHDNRVIADPSAPNGMRFEYRYTDELRSRVESFRRRLARAVAPHRTIVLSSENNLNFGHVCGTCRFGDDPTTSVLDADNRTHDVQNLYVVDASFFPSSGGVNPSLTIAANALRVAGAIERRWNDHQASSRAIR